MWGIIAKKRVKQDGQSERIVARLLLNSQMNITVKISLAARNQTLLIFPYLVISINLTIPTIFPVNGSPNAMSECDRMKQLFPRF